MIPFLFDSMDKQFTLRAAMAGVTALLASLFLGPRVIAWLRAKKLGERIEKDDSKRLDSLMKAKQGTPTMGGVFVVAAILLSLALFGNFRNPVLWVLTGLIVGLVAVGAKDDWLKLSGRSKTGMRARTKLLLQIGVALAAGAGLLLAHRAVDPAVAARLYLPLDG